MPGEPRPRFRPAEPGSRRRPHRRSGRGASLRGEGFGLNRRLVMRDAGDPAKSRDYHVMQVEPAKVEGVNAEGASVLIEFLVSDAGQAMIGIQNRGERIRCSSLGGGSAGAVACSAAGTSDIHWGLSTMRHSRREAMPSTSYGCAGTSTSKTNGSADRSRRLSSSHVETMVVASRHLIDDLGLDNTSSRHRAARGHRAGR